MENKKHNNEPYREDSRLDNIEHHLRLLKDSDIQNAKTLSNIESALVGTSFNGHKGIVTLLDELNKRVDDLEQFDKENKVYARQFKFVFGVIFVALVTLIFKVFQGKV